MENINLSSNVSEQINSKYKLREPSDSANQTGKSIFNTSVSSQSEAHSAYLEKLEIAKESSSYTPVIKEALSDYKKKYGEDADAKSREFNLYLSATYGNSGYKDKASAGKLSTISANGSVENTNKKISGRTFQDVQNVIKNGGTPKEAAALEQEILKTGSSEEVNQYIQTALARGGELYDTSMNHDKAASDREDLINKYATADKKFVKNNICGPIHGSMMEALQEAGYEAKILGGNNVDSSNDRTHGAHYTLLYKDKNGDYVFCNYGQSMRVKDAENSEQATKIAMREGYSFRSSGGFMTSQKENGNNVIGQYLHETETSYGEKHNVENSNSETAISKTKINTSGKGTSVKYARLNDINQNKVTIEHKHVNEKETAEAHAGLEVKTSDKTDAFYSSGGFGINGGLQRNFPNGVSANFDGTVSYTSGKTAAGEHGYTDISAEAGVGYSKNILEKDNLSLKSAARTSIQGGTGLTDLNAPGGFQARLTAEAGLDAEIKPNDRLSLNVTSNAGLLGDIVPGSYDKQLPSVNPAVKLNEGISAKINLSTISAGAHGSINYTKAIDNRFTTKEYNAGIDVSKEIANDKNLSLGANISSKIKDVKNGINERVKDEKLVQAEISYQSGKNTISGAVDVDINNTKKTNASLSFKRNF